jgi:hypothetical protein
MPTTISHSSRSDVLTVREVATMLKVSPKTVHRRILPSVEHFYVGRLPRIVRADFERYLSQKVV